MKWRLAATGSAVTFPDDQLQGTDPWWFARGTPGMAMSVSATGREAILERHGDARALWTGRFPTIMMWA